MAQSFPSLDIVITDYSKCYYCQTSPLPENQKYCPSCGFPQRGERQEQINFISDKRIASIRLSGAKSGVNRSRNTLFIIGGIHFLAGALLFNRLEPFIALSAIITGLIYIGLGVWANYKPFPAVLLGMILYITMQVIAAIINPVNLVTGLIFKAIIISGFIVGIRSAREAEAHEKTLETKKMDLRASNGSTDNPVS